MDVILGLGSNTAFEGKTPLILLSSAVKELSLSFNLKKVSSLYMSKPMYVEDQEYFFNAACLIEVPSGYSPFILLEKIHEIEAKFGRNRAKEIRFGPRSLDIDIEEFGSLTMESENLILPHPRIKERAFVLIPVLEIFSEYADKKEKERFSSYLDALKPEEKAEVEKCPEEMQKEFKNNF